MLYTTYKKKNEKFKVGESGHNGKVYWMYYESCHQVFGVKAALMTKFVKEGRQLPHPTNNGMKQLSQIADIDPQIYSDDGEENVEENLKKTKNI